MLYEVVEKAQHHHKVKVILLRNVDDYGRRGQVIETDFLKAHNNLLLPGFAVYHTEENCDKHQDILIPGNTCLSLVNTLYTCLSLVNTLNTAH